MQRLVNTLHIEKINSKRKLAKKWKENSEFLREEVKQMLKAEEVGMMAIGKIWPPLDE